MVSLVLPYRYSRWNDTELKYSLRSIQKHLSNYGELFIIGDRPKGFKDYIHIPFKDNVENVWKEKNIFGKVMMAVNDERVSDDFLYINDDHFLLHNHDARFFPYYYGEWPVKSDMYKTTIEQTRAVFAKYDYVDENKFFDLHCPLTIHKEWFDQVNRGVDWNVKAGYCMKTLYCSLIISDRVHEYYPDLKIRLQYPQFELLDMIKNRLWFSTDDQARSSELEGLLKKLYPVKSKWEL